MSKEIVQISKCTRCPHFSPGHNDPMCGLDYGVMPNSGIWANNGPPTNCPLRKSDHVRITTLDPEVL